MTATAPGSASSPSPWGRNLNALAKRDPDVAKRLSQHAPTATVWREASGLANARFGSEALYTPDAADAVQRFMGAISSDRSRLFVLFGLGLGYELAALQPTSHAGRNVHRVLVIEPNLEVLAQALLAEDLSPLLEDPDIIWMLGVPLEALYSELYKFFFNAIHMRYLQSMTVEMAASARFSSAYWSTALAQLTAAAKEAISDLGNDVEDSLLGLRNIVRNTETIASGRDLGPAEGAFSDTTAIVVAAGPSLPKQFPRLRALEGRVVLVAADTALVPLLQAGIRPHFVASKERTIRTLALLDVADTESSVLVACPVVAPECFAAYRGPIIPAFTSTGGVDAAAGIFSGLGLDRHILRFGGSGANMAFQLAVHLGCPSIILVGQDLAFGRDGATHTQGAPLGERRSYFTEGEKVRLPGYYGGEVDSTPDWARFRKQYEYDIVNYDGQCWNATEGGAAIPGAKPQSLAALSEAIAPPQKSIRDRALALAAPLPPEQVTDARQRIETALHGAARDIRCIEDACRAGLARCGAPLEAATAAAGAAWTRTPHQKVEALMAEPAFQAAYDARVAAFMGPAHESFRNFILPTAQARMTQIEMALYAVEKQNPPGADAARSIAALLERWFTEVLAIASETRALLESRSEEAISRRPKEGAESHGKG